MQETSIFSSDFSEFIAGEGNPLEDVYLSPREKEILDELSGAKYAREKRELEELRKTVAVNELTGTLKWRSELAQRQIAGDLDAAGRTNQEVWLGIFDLDILKYLNDNWGYLKGDKVLKAMAASLDRSIRKSDSLFSFGVDEFPVLFIGAKKEELPIIIERMSSSFNAKIKELVESGDIPVEMVPKSSFSGGIVRANIKEDLGDRGVAYEDPETLFDRADSKLHQTKRSGRNLVMIDGDSTAYNINGQFSFNAEDLEDNIALEERYN